MVRNGVSVSYKVERLYYVGGSCNFMYYFLDLLFIVSVNIARLESVTKLLDLCKASIRIIYNFSIFIL